MAKPVKQVFQASPTAVALPPAAVALPPPVVAPPPAAVAPPPPAVAPSPPRRSKHLECKTTIKMSPTTMFIALFLLLCGTALSANIKKESGMKRIPRESRIIRQSPTDSSACTGPSNCLSTTFNVPTSLVDCIDGRCVCNDCFMLDPGRGTCFNCSDYLYFASNGTCGTDNRQDQRRAFFLSLFFSSTGAANFYIRSYGLAVGQLIVLIIFVISVIILICPCCICCGCVNKEGAIKGTCLFIILFILSVVFVIVMGALIVSWWIGDLSIFAGNERKTGSGCFPRSNL